MSVAARLARIHDGVHPSIQDRLSAWEAEECIDGREKQEPYSKTSDSHFLTTRKKKEGRKGEEVRATVNGDVLT